jgi:hypothetical protein
VNVCLVDATTGKVLIDSVNLETGQDTELFRARRLHVTFGNGQATMRVSGKDYPVRETTDGIGYELRAGHAPRELSAERRPTCAS